VLLLTLGSAGFVESVIAFMDVVENSTGGELPDERNKPVTYASDVCVIAGQFASE
jgi:hypothetical protein